MNEFKMVSADELNQVEGGGLFGAIASALYNIGKAIVSSQINDATTVAGAHFTWARPWSTNCSKTTGGLRRATEESLNLGGAGSPAFKVAAET